MKPKLMSPRHWLAPGAAALLGLSMASGSDPSHAAPDFAAIAPPQAPEVAVPAPARAATMNLALGERMYGERCAGCHDNPTGRTPDRAGISVHSFDSLLRIMLDGPMRPFAQGLTRGEVAAIAMYVSRQRPSRSEQGQARPPAPRCASPRRPLHLETAHWNGWGRTVRNARFQPEPGLSAADVPRLRLKWTFPHAGNRTGQATVVDGRLFVNSNSGSVYSLDAATGCIIWHFQADGGTRSTISIGRISAQDGAPRHAAYFTDSTRHAYAVDADTGELIWKTQVDNQRGSLMTGSPTLHDGRLFVPVSSAEEAIALNDDYECCKVRGNLVALDASTGALLWKTYTTRQENRPYRLNARGVQMYGPAGGAIWSAPTIDERRNLVYVATSNSHTDFPHEGSDAVIAIDIESGAIRWINQVTPNDNYIIDCYPTTHPRSANCPRTIGGDYALGSSPILQDLPDGRQFLLAAQKSSELYAMDPAQNGRIVWQHRFSSGGPLGGIQFGHATDGAVVYVPVSDIFMYARARPGLTAVRLSDGKVLWHTPNPGPSNCRWSNAFCNPGLSQAISTMPGIVFAGSMDGVLRAYSATDGRVVWQFHTAAEPYRALNGEMVEGGILDAAGPTIANGMVYVNSGYAGRSGEGGSVLMAFSVDGR